MQSQSSLLCVPAHNTVIAGTEDDEGLLKGVEFYALDSRQESILWDVKPAFVIVYDPDVTLVRQLEVRLETSCPLHNRLGTHLQ